MTKKQIYKKALIVWGRTSQMDMLVEECAELIKAMQKLNHPEIDKIKKQKLARLERLLCL
jgi:hypothetical protein